MAAPSNHVFISYSTANSAWVDALARNLTAAGKGIFIDHAALIPGQRQSTQLEGGITTASAAILVVSPESYQSGWVANEWDALLERTVHDPGFPVIPVVYGTVEGEHPFLRGQVWVDFRPPHAYRTAFARLLAGLERRPPGLDPDYDGPLITPAATAAAPSAVRASVAEVVRRLDGARIVLLLARDGVAMGRVAAFLKEELAPRMPPGQVRHLALPVISRHTQTKPLFEHLARAAGVERPVRDVGSLQVEAMALLEHHPGPWLWLVTGFENSADAVQHELAVAIRALVDAAPNLQVVLCGGRKLHEQARANGNHSAFFGAIDVMWPDPTTADLRAELPAEIGADDGTLAQALAAAGGHLALAREAMDAWQAQDGGDSANLTSSLSRRRTLMNIVLAVRHGNADRLRRLMALDLLGPHYDGFQPDPVLRALYWHRLATPDRGQLVWASRAIRAGVAEIMDYLDRSP